MLLNMHNAGYIDFIGFIVTSDDSYVPLCASSINTYYNNPDIPIGFLKPKSSSNKTRLVEGIHLKGQPMVDHKLSIQQEADENRAK